MLRQCSKWVLTFASQDCDVRAIDALGATFYNFNNTGARGTPPCRLQLQNSGSFAVIDSLNIVWQVNLAIVPAVGASGVISAGQNLAQVHPEKPTAAFQLPSLRI